jgi:hypothetical protein
MHHHLPPTLWICVAISKNYALKNIFKVHDCGGICVRRHCTYIFIVIEACRIFFMETWMDFFTGDLVMSIKTFNEDMKICLVTFIEHIKMFMESWRYHIDFYWRHREALFFLLKSKKTSCKIGCNIWKLFDFRQLIKYADFFLFLLWFFYSQTTRGNL